MSDFILFLFVNITAKFYIRLYCEEDKSNGYVKEWEERFSFM